MDDYGKVRLAVGRPEYEPIELERVTFSVTPPAQTIEQGKDRSFQVFFDPREVRAPRLDRRLQPYVLEAAALCSRGCNPTHTY